MLAPTRQENWGVGKARHSTTLPYHAQWLILRISALIRDFLKIMWDKFLLLVFFSIRFHSVISLLSDQLIFSKSFNINVYDKLKHTWSFSDLRDRSVSKTLFRLLANVKKLKQEQVLVQNFVIVLHWPHTSSLKMILYADVKVSFEPRSQGRTNPLSIYVDMNTTWSFDLASSKVGDCSRWRTWQNSGSRRNRNYTNWKM